MGFGLDLIKDTGRGAVNTVVGQGLDLLFGGMNDKRQLEQQRKLQELQIAGSKKLSDYNLEQQMKLWRDTNYSAQIEEMKKAGLSPSLMMSKGGSSGSTGIVAGGLPSTGNADSGVSRTAMGLEMSKQIAELKLIEAQAKKTEAEAKNESGVNTDLKNAQIDSLTQGIKNQQAVQELTKTQDRLLKFEAKIKEFTEDEILEKIGYETQILKNQSGILRWEHDITASTAEEKIKIAENELINIGLQGILLKGNINLNNIEARKKAEEINSIIQERVLNLSKDQQGWESLSQNDKRLRLEKEANGIKQQIANTMGVQVGLEAIEKLLKFVPIIK